MDEWTRHIYSGHLLHAYTVLASIPGRTEDGPGIDCLRMHHIIPRNWGLQIS